MPHRDFIRPFGQWSNEMVPTPADWQRFDVAQGNALDGTGSGLYTPQTPIIVGGAGIQFTPTGLGTWALSGGITTINGGRFVHDSSDFTTTDTRLRTIVVPFVPAMAGDADALNVQQQGAPSFDASLDGVTGVFGASGDTMVSIDRWLHQGATLSGVTLYAASRAQSSSVSANLVRYDGSGNKVGVYSLSPQIISNASAANYAPRPFALSFTGGGTTNVIDRRPYYYSIQLIGDSTTIFTCAALTLSDITDLRGN